MRRLTLLFVVLLLLTLAACRSGAATSPTPSSIPPTPTPTVAAQPGATPTVEPLFLEVTAPADESTVFASSVRVEGRTVTDAVVTVDGLVATVAANGGFSADVSLVPGPNFIEVIASNGEGEQAVGLSIIYLD